MFTFSSWIYLLFLGFSSLCQALARAAPAARCVWEQRRRGDPFHGGGCCGDRSVLDQPGHTQGWSHVREIKNLKNFLGFNEFHYYIRE